MKRILITTAAIAATSTAAFAGNIAEPAPEPVVQQPAPQAVEATPTYDFSGFSAGAQLGYGDIQADGDGADLDGDGTLYGLRMNYDRDFGNFVLGGGVNYDGGEIELDDGPAVDGILRAGPRAGLADLRHAYPAACFVGTVPAIKPAAERSRSGLVSVLATPATVRRDYTRQLIATFAAHCEINLVGSRQLARLAEAHVQNNADDDAAIRAEIAPCFIEKAGQRTDIVVLACTHYPFLAGVFERLAPWPVQWLDPAPAIARHVLSVSTVALGPAEPAAVTGEGTDPVALFTSRRPNPAQRRLMEQFGLRVAVPGPGLIA